MSRCSTSQPKRFAFTCLAVLGTFGAFGMLLVRGELGEEVTDADAFRFSTQRGEVAGLEQARGAREAVQPHATAGCGIRRRDACGPWRDAR